jgi:hypothetical protein
VQANQAILELEQQLTQVKNTFFSVTGRRAQTLPIQDIE